MRGLEEDLRTKRPAWAGQECRAAEVGRLAPPEEECTKVVRCIVVRGLAREVGEEINKFLSINPGRVLHMAQSESSDFICVTLIFEDPERRRRARCGVDSKHQEGRP